MNSSVVDIVFGGAIVLAMAYLIPIIIVELVVRKGTPAEDRTAHRRFRLTSFGSSLLLSLVWVGIVQLWNGYLEFSHVQVGLACASALVLIVWLTALGKRWGLTDRNTLLLNTVYGALAPGVVFTAYGAATDSTGMFGVGVFLVAVGGLIGFYVVSSIALGLRGQRRGAEVRDQTG